MHTRSLVDKHTCLCTYIYTRCCCFTSTPSFLALRQASLNRPPRSPATDPEPGSSQDWGWVFGGSWERVRIGNDSSHWDEAEMRLAIVGEKSKGLKRLAQPLKTANIPKAQAPGRVWLGKDSKAHLRSCNCTAQSSRRQVPTLKKPSRHRHRKTSA